MRNRWFESGSSGQSRANRRARGELYAIKSTRTEQLSRGPPPIRRPPPGHPAAPQLRVSSSFGPGSWLQSARRPQDHGGRQPPRPGCTVWSAPSHRQSFAVAGTTVQIPLDEHDAAGCIREWSHTLHSRGAIAEAFGPCANSIYRHSRCNDRPHSPASVEFKLLWRRPTCSIVHIGCVAFGINWSKTESTTTRTDRDETTGALNGSTAPICFLGT